MLKVAQSADGYITKVVGQSTKITDASADVATHEQRAQVGAIIVGSETALTDTPSLTVRHTSMTHPQPLRVILDRRGRLQSESQFFDDRTLIYTMNEAFAGATEQAILFDGRLQSMLDDLGHRGVQSVLVEGGGAVLRAFLATDLWQQLDIYQTTTVFGTGWLVFRCQQLARASQSVSITRCIIFITGRENNVYRNCINRWASD